MKFTPVYERDDNGFIDGKRFLRAFSASLGDTQDPCKIVLASILIHLGMTLDPDEILKEVRKEMKK